MSTVDEALRRQREADLSAGVRYAKSMMDKVSVRSTILISAAELERQLARAYVAGRCEGQMRAPHD